MKIYASRVLKRLEGVYSYCSCHGAISVMPMWSFYQESVLD